MAYALLSVATMQHLLAEHQTGFHLASLWHDLCHGSVFVRETHCTAGRCFAVLERRAQQSHPRAHQLRSLERVLLGESQKVVASELEVSAATIAGYCMTVLGGMVTGHLVSRAPIVLVMAVFASQGFAVEPARCETELHDGCSVISVAVPGETFRDRLSTGEWEIARLSIEGLSHSAMALVRGTSIRTVANQLASAFIKLGVSGRAELRAKAVRELGQYRATMPPRLAPAQLDETLSPWPISKPWPESRIAV
jgi:DNA-binding CsgD family transcriptional regulator